MKKNGLIFSALILVALTGCASYNAAPLNTLSSDVVSSSSNNNDVIITARAFDKQDCKRYLDRDVIKKGYQPIQLFIQNNSDKNYIFSLNRIDLSYAHSEEVADKVHTSTVGRIVGYGVPGVFVLWPLIIPAVIDGIKSAEANEALDYDFSSKIARDQTIRPHSYFNKIIFVPVDHVHDSFKLILIDQETHKPETFTIAVS